MYRNMLQMRQSRIQPGASIRIDCRKNINELNFMKQIMHNVLKAAVFSAMLLTVAAGYAQTKRYPYVQDGKIIVCREGTNGVKSSLIHANWTSTPSHNEKGAANCFAAKFQVADSETSSTLGTTAASSCPSGWRLPTVRELSLMYALRDELTAVGQFGDGGHWSATNVSDQNGYLFCIDFTTGEIRRLYPFQTLTLRARCIRDL